MNSMLRAGRLVSPSMLVVWFVTGCGGSSTTSPSGGLSPQERQTVQDGLNNISNQAVSQASRAEVPEGVELPRAVSVRVSCPGGGFATASGNITVTGRSISGRLNLSFNHCNVGSSLVLDGGPISVGISGSCPPSLRVTVSGSVRVLRQVGGSLVPADDDFRVSSTVTASC